MLAYLTLIDDPIDKSRFIQIYEEYQKIMYYTAYRILGDQKDTEDVVHDSFLKLIEILPQIEEVRCHKTKSLLVTIVERKAIDLYRKRKIRKTISLNEEYINVPHITDIEDIPTRTDLGKALALLPTRSRQLLLLKYYNGYSEKEIASILSMGYASVRKEIQRAKKKLQLIMGEYSWED